MFLEMFEGMKVEEECCLRWNKFSKKKHNSSEVSFKCLPKKKVERREKNFHQDSWALIALGLAIELSIQRVQMPGDALPKSMVVSGSPKRW